MYKIIKQGSCRVFGRAFDKKALAKFYDIPAYCIYLELNNRRIVLDTGYNHEFFKATKSFPQRVMRYVTPVDKRINSFRARLKEEGIDVNNNLNILISHWHPDHIGSLKEVKDCQIYASTLEYSALSNLGSFKQTKSAFLKDLVPQDLEFNPIESCKKVDDLGEYFDIVHDIFGDKSVLALSLFGHSPNQYGYYIPEHKLLYVGDAIYTARNLIEDDSLFSTLLKIAWDRDEAQRTYINLKKFMMAYPETKLIASHDIYLREEVFNG